MEWTSTRETLASLEKLLTCGLCKDYLSDPCTLSNCDHSFCRKCIEERLGHDSRCPECGAFSWLKDLKSNQQLAIIVTMTVKLRSLVGSSSKVFLESHSESSRVDPAKSESLDDAPGSPVPHFEPVLDTSDVNPPLTQTLTQADISERSSRTSQETIVSKKVTVQALTKQHLHSSDPSATKYPLRNKLKRESFESSDDASEQGGSDHKRRSSNSNYQRSNTAELAHDRRKSKRQCSLDLYIEKSREPASKRRYFTQLRAKPTKSAESKTIMDETVRNADGRNKNSTGPDARENLKPTVKKRNVGKSVVEAGYSDSSTKCCTPQRVRKSSANATISPSQSSRNKKGETLLHLAAIKGDVSLAQQLLTEDADPNVKDNAGWTPLHEASNHGYVDIVKLFLDNGALINIPGFDNDTPLHDAVANGRVEVVKLLVERGASLTARNKQGLVPKDYAVTDAMKDALSPKPRKNVNSHRRGNEKDLENKDSMTIVKKLDDSCPVSKVILTTALAECNKETLKKCVSLLGGTIVNEFSESVTHVVTSISENGHCPRTMKYFSGIVTGKWIVRFQWITNCFRKRQWISEEAYEVQGTAGKTTDGPRKARHNASQHLPRLLDGCSFFLRGSFKPPSPAKADLVNLIKLGGGKILQREPKMKDGDLTSLPSSPIVSSLTRAPEVAYHAPLNSSLSCCTQFIIFDPTFSTNAKIVHSPLVCSAPVTWLINCISSFQLLEVPHNSKHDY